MQRDGETTPRGFQEFIEKQITSIIVPPAVSIVIYGLYIFFPGEGHHWL